MFSKISDMIVQTSGALSSLMFIIPSFGKNLLRAAGIYPEQKSSPLAGKGFPTIGIFGA